MEDRIEGNLRKPKRQNRGKPWGARQRGKHAAAERGGAEEMAGPRGSGRWRNNVTRHKEERGRTGSQRWGRRARNLWLYCNLGKQLESGWRRLRVEEKGVERIVTFRYKRGRRAPRGSRQPTKQGEARGKLC